MSTVWKMAQRESANAEAYSDAVEQAVLEYAPVLNRYCLSLTHASDTAADLVQETWLRAIQRWGRFPQTLQLPYLVRIARNAWIDHCRRVKRSESVTFEMTQDSAERIDSLEVRDAVTLLVRTLSKTQRLVFLLREVHQFTTRELAEMAEVHEGAVKAALHRARTALARMNAAEWSEGRLRVLGEDDASAIDAYVASILSGNPDGMLAEWRNIHLDQASDVPKACATAQLSAPSSVHPGHTRQNRTGGWFVQRVA